VVGKLELTTGSEDLELTVHSKNAMACILHYSLNSERMPSHQERCVWRITLVNDPRSTGVEGDYNTSGVRGHLSKG
jgi:hypothetical protein